VEGALGAVPADGLLAGACFKLGSVVCGAEPGIATSDVGNVKGAGNGADRPLPALARPTANAAANASAMTSPAITSQRREAIVIRT